jgi:hypothetical protein
MRFRMHPEYSFREQGPDSADLRAATLLRVKNPHLQRAPPGARAATRWRHTPSPIETSYVAEGRQVSIGVKGVHGRCASSACSAAASGLSVLSRALFLPATVDYPGWYAVLLAQQKQPAAVDEAKWLTVSEFAVTGGCDHDPLGRSLVLHCPHRSRTLAGLSGCTAWPEQ